MVSKMNVNPKKLLNSDTALSAQMLSLLNKVFVFLDLVVKEQVLLTFPHL